MSDPVRILISDPLDPETVERFSSSGDVEVVVQTGIDPAELPAVVRQYHGMVVRSGTRVTAEALADPGLLRVIGRAGSGVDNIDLDAATAAGVVVMNTPGGNSVAAAEHTLALLTSLARHLPQAATDLKAGNWNRKRYMGTEVTGKTLGIVGLGRVGREVALRARGMHMEVLGYDPYVSDAVAAELGIAPRTLPDLLAESDFVTLHLPISGDTRHLIDAAAIAAMKPGARLINCARGGLVDEAALASALESGHLAGAALDVFEAEPPDPDGLVGMPGVIATPHLGASTREAQIRVAAEICEKVKNYLLDGTARDAVNPVPKG
ncbi:MAG: hypothetical protein IFK94_08355 [Acidobacteria bacterium]|uniref:Phosphoglycerate dehydrogenase n=1 Tax=Candidatus Polarisedimenticola svalbardensis TaxID=2886004 RepID=A0A8J6Y0P0_9BACT|nr:hypothetical protein [Candidatus Polarisedimenticola svalbardensis]